MLLKLCKTRDIVVALEVPLQYIYLLTTYKRMENSPRGASANKFPGLSHSTLALSKCIEGYLEPSKLINLGTDYQS